MRKTTIFLPSILIVMLALPAAALAGSGHHHRFTCTNSAVCQYSENVPGAGGDQPTSGGGSGGHSSGGGDHQAISPSTQRALESQGPNGAATAALADATAPSGIQGSGASGSGHKAQGDSGASSGGGASSSGTGGAPGIGKALGHVLNAGDPGSGMGIALPVILAASLLAALVFVFGRRRRAEPS